MEKAKAAIKDFTSRTGHHDTTVHETVSPHVQHETVKPHHHENVTTAVDKEVHQDHYHTTVQPVHDREVLPEQHTAKLGEVQHRTFDNRDHEGTKRSLATEGAQFKDERIVHDSTHSQAAAPTVGGEHHHHHIHENIQPIVQKETIQPHVTHTTVPIHETHHNPAQHHSSSTLPAVSLSEFKNRGGTLGGREERYDAFEGEPKNIGGFAQGAKDSIHGLGHNKHDSHHNGSGLGAERGLAGSDHTGHHHSGAGAGAAGAAAGVAGERALGHSDHTGHEHSKHAGAGAGLAGAATGVAAERGLGGRDHAGQHTSNTGLGSGTGAGFGNDRGVTGSDHTGHHHTSGAGLGSERTGNTFDSNRTGGTLGSGMSGSDRTGGVGTERGLNTQSGQQSGHISERTGGGPLDSQRDSAHHGNSSGLTGDKTHGKGVEQPGANLGREARDGQVGTGVPGFGTHEKSKQGAGPSVGAPSLKDKLDPRVDADGDGKAGIGK